MASPISRCAVARRVTESIISSTSAPSSRNASAIVVATNAALIRTSAGSSEVATTTTERSSAAPRSRSMNSRTSRPRSPTRQMTLTSPWVERAIMPSSDRLADAGAGEDAEPLAAPARHQRVERAHAERQPAVDHRARQRGRRRSGCGAKLAGADRRPTVDRAAEAVQHPSQQLRRRPAPGTSRRSPRPGCRGRSPACRRAASAVSARRGSRPPRRVRPGGCARSRSCTARPPRRGGRCTR